MKMTYSTLFLTTLSIVVLSSINSFAQIIIPNADFEMRDTNSPTGSLNWKPEYEYEQGGIDSVTVWKGKYSMHLVKLSSNGTARFNQVLPFTSTSLRKFRISGAIKTKDINEHHAAIFARVTDNNNQLICYQNMGIQGADINKTRDWKIYQGDFYVTENVSSIKVGGFIQGSGKLGLII